MQKVKCIAKNKNRNGVITQYQIQDVNGKIMTVTPEQLKEAIKSKKVECVNLTLTSNNRLINKGKTEKKEEKLYISPSCKWTPYGTNPELDKKVDSKYMHNRVEAAEQGYGLDKLVDDENSSVRAAVADQGYGLNKLVDDEHYRVREAVADQGYGLDKLVDDEDYRVREAVKEYLEDNSYKSISDWIKANPDKVYNK